MLKKRTLFRLKYVMLILSSIIFFVEHGYAKDANSLSTLKSGKHFAIMRHSIAPGSGDPQHFELGNCSTQRNLSVNGRNQAQNIGNLFRENGIDKARIYSSQWCRCLETAELLSLGTVEELPVINSFFQNFEREETQTQMLKTWLTEQDLAEPLVLVTHQVNITALTHVYPASGEIIIVLRSDSGDLSVVERLLVE